MSQIDLSTATLREMNDTLQNQTGTDNQTAWEVLNPRGSHAVAVGLDAPITVTVKGSTGYYCAGMNQQATVRVEGSVGPGVAENSIPMTSSLAFPWTPFEKPSGSGQRPSALWAISRWRTCVANCCPWSP